MDPGETFCHRIGRVRAARGLTQSDLSKLTGIARGTIGKLEANVQRVTLSHAAAIAQALGVSIDAMISRQPVAVEVTDEDPWGPIRDAADHARRMTDEYFEKYPSGRPG